MVQNEIPNPNNQNNNNHSRQDPIISSNEPTRDNTASAQAAVGIRLSATAWGLSYLIID